MTITTDFTGTENYAERMAGLEAIHDWWFGAGSFAAAATLGQVRANLNTLLVGTTILNRETFATWLSKVNTLNEPTDYAAALTFGESQSGALWQCTLPASLRAATDGTGEVAVAAAIARINDSSGNALHPTQASTALRPIRGRRPNTGTRNLFAYSEGAVTAYPSRTEVVTASETIPGFDNAVEFGDNSVQRYAYLGTGLTESTTYRISAYVMMADGLAPVVGSPAGSVDFGLVLGGQYADGDKRVVDLGGGLYRVSASRTTGNVSLFVNGIGKSPVHSSRGFRVTGLQVEYGSAVETAYQKVSSVYDISEDGADPVSYARFDLVDDALTTGAIAGGLTGQAFVAGDGGCYVSALSVAPGGTFSIGGTSHNWTGAVPGILRAVTGDTGRVLDVMIREGSFTEDELARLERYYRALGGKGLLVPGPELVVNGGFDTDLTGWSNSSEGTGSAAYSSGAVALEGTNASNRGRIVQNVAVVAGMAYRVSADVLSISGGIGIKICPPGEVVSATGADAILASGQNEFAYIAQPGDSRFVVWTGGTGGQITIDNVSIRPLIPREDL